MIFSKIADNGSKSQEGILTVRGRELWMWLEACIGAPRSHCLPDRRIEARVRASRVGRRSRVLRVGIQVGVAANGALVGRWQRWGLAPMGHTKIKTPVPAILPISVLQGAQQCFAVIYWLKEVSHEIFPFKLQVLHITHGVSWKSMLLAPRPSGLISLCCTISVFLYAVQNRIFTSLN